MNKLEKANNYQNKYRIDKKERPLFHISPAIGWLNDPNGFSEFNGKKHIFYQYHPYSYQWGPMHWAHLQTDDFIKWEELPVALAPDSFYDSFGCFSGSAITKDEKHYLLYTGVREEEGDDGFLEEIQTQCLAIGDGRTYKKLNEVNPVINSDMLPEGFSINHFRDPKVWKDEDYYYLVVGNLDQNNLGQVLLFQSPNLQNWEFLTVLQHNTDGRYGKMWECPDFFELDGKHILIVSPQDMLAGEDDFLNGNHTIYFLGDFDKTSNTFNQPDADLLDYGSEFYAAQTMLTEDGRRIMIAWLSSWDIQTREREQKWNGMLTLPRELEVKNNQLYQRPIRELENYWGEGIKEEVEISGIYKNELLKGKAVDLSVELLGGDYNEFIIHFNHKDDYDTRFIYNKEEGTITFDRTYSGIRRDVVCERTFKLKESEGPINFRLILDRYSAELFVNDGLQTLSASLASPDEADQIYFECDGTCTMNIDFHPIQIEE